jgi:hypothetical protein
MAHNAYNWEKSMGERVTVVLDDGAANLLIDLADSSRKQDGYLRRLIRAAHDNAGAINSETMNFEGLRLQILGIAGQQKAVEGRHMNVEQQLAVLIAADS